MPPTKIFDITSSTSISTSLLSPNSKGVVLIRLPSSCNLVRKRQRVLDVTRRLLCREANEKEVIELKENGLISDVPKSNTGAVSSAACQVRQLGADFAKEYDNNNAEEEEMGRSSIRKNVQSLSSIMYEAIAAVCKSCDDALGLTSSDKSLSSVLARSESAKARMIYYHALVNGDDNDAEEKEKIDGKIVAKKEKRKEEEEEFDSDISNLGNWQAWHYDYGLFTALISPQLLSSSGLHRGEEDVEQEEEGNATKIGDDSMKDYSLEEESNTKSINRGGLLVLSSDTEMMTTSTIMTKTKEKVYRIHIPRDAVAIQVGEAAAILTGGRLKACLHCVARPRIGTQLVQQKYTRQTFVLFAQPPWSQSMQALDTSLVKEDMEKGEKVEINSIYDSAHNDVILESLLVPALSHRFKPQMTFSEFAAKTTKAYYGKKTGKQV